MTTTKPTPALESALAKLRECADMTMFVEVNHDEAAALLAKIEAADRLAEAIESYRTFEDVTVRVLDEALAAYRNPQPAAEGE